MRKSAGEQETVTYKMSNSYQVRLKQTQKLVITQELRQSIEMLQLSSLELAELISTELLENPLLEEIETHEEATQDDLVSRNLSGDDMPDERENYQEVTAEDSAEWSDEYREDDRNRRRQYLENAVTPHESLAEHLMAQASVQARDNIEKKLFSALIYSLDENGFFTADPEVIAHAAGASPGLMNNIIETVNYLDPVGCAVRDSRESLLVQAKHLYPGDDIVHSIIREHFTDLERLDYDTITRTMEIDLPVLMSCVRQIQTLDPFPGNRYSRQQIRYIIPDVDVSFMDGEIIVTLRNENVPRIGINGYYSRLLKKSEMDKEQREYINERMQAAKNFIRNIETRGDTIRRVVTTIMEDQVDFLREGPGHLRSLTHLEVSEKLGIHESTVSRVASNKYMQTAWGIFPLKYFFVSRLRNHDGKSEEEVSSDRVRTLIQELLASEDPAEPYSDDQLVTLCRERGITVARRTVAKYRGMLDIPSSSRRRKLNLIRQEGIV